MGAIKIHVLPISLIDYELLGGWDRLAPQRVYPVPLAVRWLFFLIWKGGIRPPFHILKSLSAS